MGNTEIVQFLKKCTPCHDFTSRELDHFASICTETTYNAGDTILVEGDSRENIHSYYLLVSGDLQIGKDFMFGCNEKNMLVNILTAGDSFGEIALIQEQKTRTATVKALTDSKLLKVSRQDFLHLYRSNHKFANNLTNIIIGYLNHSNNLARYIMFSSRDIISRISFLYDFLAGKYGEVQADGSCEINLPFNSQLILEFLGMQQQVYSRKKKNIDCSRCDFRSWSQNCNK